MAVDVSIPKLGMSMTEGKLVEWLVADGASVSEGTPIYSRPHRIATPPR
jgi:pyruvate/2-oxoglutarate dehydrogenase complex dihydrolipoamide acyltransferase (E2) component